MNKNQVLVAGAVLGLLAVALGAFGAHALKPYLVETGRLDTFENAVKYQFYHALALLFLSIFMKSENHRFLKSAALLFLSGVIIFSGSLYILCLTNTGIWSAITPIGGVLMIAGWGFLIYFGIKKAG